MPTQGIDGCGAFNARLALRRGGTSRCSRDRGKPTALFLHLLANNEGYGFRHPDDASARSRRPVTKCSDSGPRITLVGETSAGLSDGESLSDAEAPRPARATPSTRLSSSSEVKPFRT